VHKRKFFSGFLPGYPDIFPGFAQIFHFVDPSQIQLDSLGLLFIQKYTREEREIISGFSTGFKLDLTWIYTGRKAKWLLSLSGRMEILEILKFATSLFN